MKNYNFLIRAMLLAVIVFGGGLFAYAQNRQVLAKAESVTGDRFPIALRTPKGASIFAAVQPSQPMLSAIDKGLTDLFAVAERMGIAITLIIPTTPCLSQKRTVKKTVRASIRPT